MTFHRRKSIPELSHQKYLCEWIARFPHINAHWFHVPNGLLTNRLSSDELRARGVKRGVPDFFLAIPISPYHGFFLELKRDDKSKPSLEQTEWLGRLEKKGFAVTIANGWIKAKEKIESYLGGCHASIE